MGRRHRNSFVRVFTWVLLIAVLLFVLPPTRRALEGVGVTINLLVPSGEWRPLRWFSQEPAWREVEATTEDARSITVRIYETEEAARLGMVIYTPLIAGGLDDARLVNLATTWARAGVPVAVPFDFAQGKPVIGLDDIDAVVKAAQVLREQTGATKLVLFGISYGNGPTFHAAVDGRIRDNVVAIVSLNGMYDLANVVEFIDSGRSHEYGREVVAATRARGINLNDVREQLSPATVLDQLNVPVYIVHSTSDEFIPYSESEQLHAGLPGSRFVLTDVIDHGAYRPITFKNVFEKYIPAGVGFTQLVYELLALR